MDSDQLVLHVGPGPELLRRADQHAHFPALGPGKKLAARRICCRVMNERDLLGRDLEFRHEQTLELVIEIEALLGR